MPRRRSPAARSTPPSLSAEARAEAGHARRLRLLCPRPRHGCPPRRRYVAPGRDRRMGEPGGLDFGPRLLAPRRLERRVDRLPAGCASWPSNGSFAPAVIIGPRAPSRRRPSALGRAAAQGRGNNRRSSESFYGLLARETLGMSTELASDPFIGDDPPIDAASQHPARGRARAGSASPRWPSRCFATRPDRRAVRASRTDPARQDASTCRPPSCGSPTTANGARPSPTAIPTALAALSGWRVDPALAFGHIVQELAFRRCRQPRRRRRPDAGRCRSPPKKVSNSRGVPYSRAALTDPKYNLEFGQSFHRDDAAALRALRASCRESSPRTTRGRCRSARWAESTTRAIRCCGSNHPHWETRYYVPAVMRNMWVYQGSTTSRRSP